MVRGKETVKWVGCNIARGIGLWCEKIRTAPAGESACVFVSLVSGQSVHDGTGNAVPQRLVTIPHTRTTHSRQRIRWLGVHLENIRLSSRA